MPQSREGPPECSRTLGEFSRPVNFIGRQAQCLVHEAQALSGQGPVGWPNGLLGWMESKIVHVPAQDIEVSLVLHLLQEDPLAAE